MPFVIVDLSEILTKVVTSTTNEAVDFEKVYFL